MLLHFQCKIRSDHSSRRTCELSTFIILSLTVCPSRSLSTAATPLIHRPPNFAQWPEIFIGLCWSVATLRQSIRSRGSSVPDARISALDLSNRTRRRAGITPRERHCACHITPSPRNISTRITDKAVECIVSTVHAGQIYNRDSTSVRVDV